MSIFCEYALFVSLGAISRCISFIDELADYVWIDLSYPHFVPIFHFFPLPTFSFFFSSYPRFLIYLVLPLLLPSPLFLSSCYLFLHFFRPLFGSFPTFCPPPFVRFCLILTIFRSTRYLWRH